jgi:protein-S-isoprenylcysteine O-methyltransferase Ste14
MIETLLFRIIAVILLILFFADIILIAIAISRKREKPFSPVHEKKMPTGLYILWRFLMYLPLIVIILAILLPQLVYRTIFNVSFPGDTYVQVAGIIIYIIGGIIFYYSSKYLGRYMVPRAVLAKDHDLITQGPFSKVRHPTYTSYILINLSIALFSLNLVLLLCFLFAVLTTNYKAKVEEELLSSEKGFGRKYKDYMKRTGRFFPLTLH